MIYIDINKIHQEYRRALAVNPDLGRHETVVNNIERFNQANRCRVVGKLDGGGWWITDGIEFPDEETLMWFKLKWS